MKDFVINMTNLWTGTKFDNLHYQDWSTVFNSLHGPCHTIDLSKELIQTQGKIKPAIDFILAENIPWTKVNILFHTKYDLPDSVQMNGWNFLSIDNRQKEQHIFTLRKIKSTRDSTRNIPCTKFERETCQNIEDNSLVLERFNCQIPILYFGQHLDKV